MIVRAGIRVDGLGFRVSGGGGKGKDRDGCAHRSSEGVTVRQVDGMSWVRGREEGGG